MFTTHYKILSLILVILLIGQVVFSHQSLSSTNGNKQVQEIYLNTPAQKPAKPNIIFIMADDLGYSELGCYGNTFNKTPNLDYLAAQGMRFTQAYALAPVCTPTRIALMTGQHPARVGITDYLDAKDEKFLSPDYITLNEQLKKAGYFTGLVGKWHLTGDYGKRKGEPAKHGWDEVICSETGYIANGDYFHPYFFMTGVQARQPGEYLTDRLNEEAVDFIKRNKDKPFFLYLSHYAVHTALAGKPEVVSKYRNKPMAGTKQNNPALAAMLETIDDGIGQIIRTLQQEGIDKNTLIIFTSDNGGESNVTSNAPLRGGKSELYEGGIREPFITCWPAQIKSGAICETPISTVDIYPTFLEITSLQKNTKQVQDGLSILPLLQGKQKDRNTPIYWHYPLDKPHFLGGRSAGAIREGDFKLIDFFDTGEAELYNLKTDIGEKNNLAAAMPEKVTELKAILHTWRKKINAPPAHTPHVKK